MNLIPNWKPLRCVLFLTCVLAASGSMAAAKKPNILIIYADDLAPLLGSYRHPYVKSPNIDDFADEAILFENAHSNVAICTASRTSILTGVRPSSSGLYGLNHDFKKTLPKVVTLPKHFGNHGYRTIALGKIADSRGGDWSDQWDEFYFGYGLSAQQAVTILKKLENETKPWLLAVGFSEPHCPWNPSKKSSSLYDANNIQLQGPGRSRNGDYQKTCYGVGKETISEQEAIQTTLRYYATVTDLDEKVGKTIAAAKELGLFDDTVVIFWSGDHGFHLGENNHWGKWKNYRASTWVPLIMKAPGHGKPATRVPGLVETVDMYPTLVDLAGLPQPSHELEGFSFAPLLDEPDKPWKKAVFSHDSKGENRAVKTKQYNYIRSPDGSFKVLFDMVKDPQETTNILSHETKVAEKMEKLLKAGWRSALPDNPVTSPAL